MTRKTNKPGTYCARCTWVNTETGARGVYTEEPCGHGSLWIDDDGHFEDFQWSEGNYSCDDNRGIFFEGVDLPCSEHIYIIEKMEALDDDGNLLYTFPEPYETPRTR